MPPKNGANSNSLDFSLELLKLLSEKPLKKEQLVIALGDRGFEGDLSRKIERTVKKLRDCGFTIRSAPNRPYELEESGFPVILSEEQRQALALAAHLLADMGFSAQASQIYQIGNIRKALQASVLKVDFHPPVDYSEEQIDDIVCQLQERFKQRRRFVIWYRSRQGKETSWDLDKSELRLHNGVLYLFALVPDARSYHLKDRPNAEQNFMFRIDRILRVGGASTIPWTYSRFPTLKIRYRLFGALKQYEPRRSHEQIILHEEDNYIEVVTEEDSLFWFRQRMLQYGASAKVIDPCWLAEQIQQTLKQACENYGATHTV
jgi:predicted DNA-binding transcriptional regulator YafY